MLVKFFMNFTASQGLADYVVLNVKQDQQGAIWTISNLGISAVGFLNPSVNKKKKMTNPGISLQLLNFSKETHLLQLTD